MDRNEWLRLTRYITGEAQDVERRDIERWIAEVPARAELVRQLRLGWERAGEREGTFDVERAWGEVTRRKTARSAPESPRPSILRLMRRPLFRQIDHSSARRWWLTAAAVLALGMGVGWWGGHAGRRLSMATATGPMRTVATRPGQMIEIYLSDGTHVWLGAASTLRFPATFGGVRHVYLEGEGYFDVVHDPAREFAVYTAQAVARDIGTRFGVRTYPESRGTEVVVAEGAVALRPAAASTTTGVARESAVLTQSDLGRVDSAGTLTVTRRVDVETYLAWTEGRLVFADTPLREALPQLSRWYGIDLMIGDSSLADVRLTATLEVGSLADLLPRLSAVLDARVSRRGQDGKDIVLYPKHPAR